MDRPKAAASRARDHGRLLRALVERPVHTGAIAPSSRRLGRAMIEGIGLETATTIAELGPGTGVFTRLIEERSRRDAVVLVFEINPGLAQPLVADFPRFQIVNDSAEHIAHHLRANGRATVDCVVSSLPWAGFPPDLQRRLLRAVADAMRPGARFVTFAYASAAWLPAGRHFRALLEATFGKVERTPTVWRNVPPAFVYRCER